MLSYYFFRGGKGLEYVEFFFSHYRAPNFHVKNRLGMNAFPKIISPHYKEQLPKSCGSRKSSFREGSMKLVKTHPHTAHDFEEMIV
jgi:hypothetical protein